MRFLRLILGKPLSPDLSLKEQFLITVRRISMMLILALTMFILTLMVGAAWKPLLLLQPVQFFFGLFG